MLTPSRDTGQAFLLTEDQARRAIQELPIAQMLLIEAERVHVDGLYRTIARRPADTRP